MERSSQTTQELMVAIRFGSFMPQEPRMSYQMLLISSKDTTGFDIQELFIRKYSSGMFHCHPLFIRSYIVIIKTICPLEFSMEI